MARLAPRPPHDADVIIVGAGAAGLAAAACLARGGLDPLILEARDRIGGRVFTQATPGLAAPIELGAEFIHGSAAPIREIASACGLRTLDIAACRYEHTGTRLRAVGHFWERIDRVMRRLDPDREPDRSFAEALRANGRTLRAADRALATRYVEGYDAADTALVSERWLAETSDQSRDVRETRIGRLVDGYASLVDALAGDVRARIRLGTIVSLVRWRRGRVEVECRDVAGAPRRRFTARAILITVPLGVLHAPGGAVGAIGFDPAVPSLQDAASLGVMGDVVKLTLQFAEPFWMYPRFARRLGLDALDRLGFMQSRRALPFAVWWSAYPVRAPVLIAWSGGPRASALGRETAAGLERLAVESLAAMFSMRPADVRDHLVASYHHDWTNDPFSRGAYSYARVGGHRMSVRLARPIQRTIWYAGEAADRQGTTGTVHGAIASGQRAAREILRG